MRRSRPSLKADSCFYVGRRQPPNSPNKYQRKDDFWFILAVRIIIFIILEVRETVFSFTLRIIPMANIRQVESNTRLREDYISLGWFCYRENNFTLVID